MNKVTGIVLQAVTDGERRWMSVSFYRGPGYYKYYFRISKASQVRLFQAMKGWQP